MNSGLLLFLDSADPRQWERLLPSGIFHGVTTNPLLLERANEACTLERLARMATIAAGFGAREIQLQTWGETVDEMVAVGTQLAKNANEDLDVAIKVPVTGTGLRAAARLRDAGCRITLTAVYSPGQVLAAAGLGAIYAAPYLGRLDDAGRDGRGTLQAMLDILDGTGSATRLLVASLRNASQVNELAAQGFDTFTFGPAVADELLQEELTEAAARDFQRAADAMGGPAD